VSAPKVTNIAPDGEVSGAGTAVPEKRPSTGADAELPPYTVT